MSGVTGALYSAVTGLKAEATDLGIISDNISNSNTVGYKRSTAQFSTLVTQAATTNTYTPGGVLPNPHQLVTEQGALQASTSTTDIAIAGRGFFATASAISSSGTLPLGIQAQYTRAGSFQINKQGFLTNTSGQYLLGVKAVNGVVPSASLPANQLVALSVGSITGSAKATSAITIGANLAATANSAVKISSFNTYVTVGAASAHASASVTAVNVGATKGSTTNQSGTSATTGMIIQAGTTATYTSSITGITFVPSDSGFVTSVSVFDSLGVNHNLDIAFQKKAPNVWEAYVVGMTQASKTDPTTGAYLDSISGTTTNSFSKPVVLGELKFTQQGALASFTAANGNNNAPLSVTLSGAGSTGAQVFDPVINFGQLSLTSTTTGSTTGVTQLSSNTAVSFINQDGIKFGYRTGVSIDDDGVVKDIFDNGQRLTIGKIPVVTFADPDALQSVSGNLYQETDNSGSATANYSQVGGAGTIKGSSLESSTVDLSTEFTNLIVTQNSYSANARTITSANNFLQDVINLIR